MLDPLDPLDARGPSAGRRGRLDALGERYLGALADRTGSSPRRLALLALAGLAVVAGVAFVVLRSGPATSEASPRVSLPRASSSIVGGAPAPSLGSSTTAGALVVDVVGAVAHPGLVHLPGGSRVADAIAAAGGVRPDADPSQVNLARVLVDGEQVRVPVVGEVLVAPPTPAGGKSGPSVPAAPLDLNQATVDQLDALPGVGPSTAAAIVTYREQHGRFRSVEDLLEVPGIGDAKLERLRPLVTV